MTPAVGDLIDYTDYELVDNLLVQARQDIENVFVPRNIWDTTTIVNREQQFYTDGMNNLEWVDGRLELIAKPPTGDNPIPTGTLNTDGTPAFPPYTSKLLSTRQRRSYTYGRFVMKGRFPKGRGVWPAFWLLPEFDQWPPEYATRILPEIDIVEYIGDLINRYYGNVHFYENGEYRRSELAYECGNCDMTSEDHIYALDWTPEYLIWWFDGQIRKVLPTPDQMHQPYHVIVNLAIGGDWPGNPELPTDGSAPEWRFSMDRLEVYKDTRSPVIALPDTELAIANRDLIARLEPMHDQINDALRCQSTVEAKMRTSERSLRHYLNELKGIPTEL